MIGIAPEQRAALEKIGPALDASAYLAGGVAVALALNHRSSLDLDVFVPTDFDPERLAEQLAVTCSGFRVVSRAPGTLYAEVDGVPLIVLRYRYPLLEPTRESAAIALKTASLTDLACMKVAAIAGRGAAKDFWDLDELLRANVCGGDLGMVLDAYRRKYASEDVGHVVRSLAYFGDADAAPFPRGLADDRWSRIKADMSTRVKAL